MDGGEALWTFFSTFFEKVIAGTDIKVFNDHWGQLIINVFFKACKEGGI